MTWRAYILLFLLGLGFAFGVASFQSSAGYMDADYYYAEGLQIVSGRGLNEPFLWNYLDDPNGLPHPSHSYWMPLTSFMAGLGMRLFGQLNFPSARWPFIVIWAILPPLSAALSFSLISRRDLSILTGLMTVFTGYYAPFLPTTDAFGISMLLGGLFFLAITINRPIFLGFVLGILAGFSHLTRTDGVVWLLVSIIVILYKYFFGRKRIYRSMFICIFFLSLGYLLVMGPWFARNLMTFGQPFAPGGIRTLWLRRYDELFFYPASQLNFQNWIDSGWKAILQTRLWALKFNLFTTLAVQGSIFLLPLILIGLWQMRGDLRIRTGLIAWGIIFCVMTLVFPFAGARGGFFHSGAAVQLLLWSLAPIGLETFIIWGNRHRQWKLTQSRWIFSIGMVVMIGIVTLFIVRERVIGPSLLNPIWNKQASLYNAVEQFILTEGVPEGTVVIVSNPPGYNAITGRSAIVIPDGDEQTVLDVAKRYGGNYLILEPNAVPRGLSNLYKNPYTHPGFEYLGSIEEVLIFEIREY